MKIENSTIKQKNKRRVINALIIIFAALLIIVISVVFSLNYKSIFGNNIRQSENTPYDLSPPTDEQKKAGEEIKKQTLENTTTNNNLGLSFSSIAQTGSQLNIKVAISGAVSNDGTCDLTLEKDGQKIQLSKPTFALASYSTCQGFNVETGELAKGDWVINLSVTIKDKNSSITKTFSLE